MTTSLVHLGAEHWQKCTPSYIQTLPILDYPFDRTPDIFNPACTVIRMGSRTVNSFLWCYLKREVLGSNKSSFDPSSLSQVRTEGLRTALERLSKAFRFRNTRPESVIGQLRILGNLLNWADEPQNVGRFEALLTDPYIALKVLREHHSYLRGLMQSHQLAATTAAARDQCAIASLSEIHGRVFKDEIEPLSTVPGGNTKAPAQEDWEEFKSTLQAIFDSAAQLALAGEDDGRASHKPRLLRLSATDDTRVFAMRERYGKTRLMDLACVTFSGLVLVDSGANLAVLQAYEEPENLSEQLEHPERINLTHKAIKFRAGAKLVDVHLTALTMTRLKTYLKVRQELIAALDTPDIAPLFVQASYTATTDDPTGIQGLSREFLLTLRKRVKSVGAKLPPVTLKQLRAYKQQHHVRHSPLPVAAKIMGHSVETAVKAYCAAQEGVQREELSDFLGSLQKTVLGPSGGVGGASDIPITPVGACVNYGNPMSVAAAVVEPDCAKVEGCFFCDNYRVHADEKDLRKLMSCRYVLRRVGALQADALHADRVHRAVVDRIDGLLLDIQRREPAAYEACRSEVEEQGHLTRYWANKLQQLHLLGMLSA